MIYLTIVIHKLCTGGALKPPPVKGKGGIISSQHWSHTKVKGEAILQPRQTGPYRRPSFTTAPASGLNSLKLEGSKCSSSSEIEVNSGSVSARTIVSCIFSIFISFHFSEEFSSLNTIISQFRGQVKSKQGFSV